MCDFIEEAEFLNDKGQMNHARIERLIDEIRKACNDKEQLRIEELHEKLKNTEL